MIKIAKRCANCNKVIPALSTYVQVPHSEPRHAYENSKMYFCSVSCFLSFRHAEVIDPKMEQIA